MSDMVIVAYRPKPGKDAELLALIRRHVPLLRQFGLATNRPASAMRTEAGDVVEVFEWKEGAIASAHQNPAVLALWEQYAAVCDYVPLHGLPEAKDRFARFTAFDL